jgi:hypothetical protein
MVLIDGDGMIFLDDFLRDGEKGGRRAAMKLQAALEDYIESEVTGIPHDSRIVCRIYANVRGLGDVLARTGAIEETGQFGDFVRGFTQQQALFDFVDVGPGKDRADEKLVGEYSISAAKTCTLTYCTFSVPREVLEGFMTSILT